MNNLGADAARISGLQIDQWIDEGLKNICSRIPLVEAQEDLTAVSGTAAYPLVGTSLSSKTRSIRRVVFQDRRLDYITLEELDLYKRGSAAPSGTPTSYYTWANKLGLYPTPASGGTIEVYFMDSAPAALSGSTAEITAIPAHMHPLLVSYATSRGFLKLLDRKMAESYRAVYEADLGVAKYDLELDNLDTPSVVTDFDLDARPLPPWV
jgi:hypothetical protein